MTHTFDDLSHDEKMRLCDHILAKQVSIFSGSGISLDSSGSSSTMKSVGELRIDIIKANDLPSTATLSQAYAMMDDSQVETFVTDHYRCRKPGQTVLQMVNLPWKRVYTLNIDNAFETAFEQICRQREFPLTSLEVRNFDESFTNLASDTRCSVIHLHGSVAFPNSKYVFAAADYAKLMSRPNSWMVTLTQLIRTETFIVVGTSLDEIDVAFYLENRSQSTVRADVPPSILVEPFPNKLTERLCETHQFCLFKGTAVEFFDELLSLDPRLRSPWVDRVSDGLEGLGLPETQRLRFAASFELIPRDPEETPAPARFLLGADLTWSMLAANTDVAREVFSQVRTEIIKSTSDNEFRVLLLVDEPGAGKTSFLKRLAFDVSRGSASVYWYTGLGFELEPSDLALIFDSMAGTVCVFIDNFADALNSVSLFVEKMRKRDILFVCAERDYRLNYIENAFTGEDYKLIQGALGLTQMEAITLLSLHENHGLSTLKPSEVSREAYVRAVEGKTIAEATCRIQNNFKTIDRIVRDLALDCQGGERDAYLIVALARFCYSTGVRREILGSTTAHDSLEFLLSEKSSLPIRYSDQRHSFIVPKQQIIADRFLEIRLKAHGREILQAFIDLSINVAPRVSPKTIRAKTPESQLLGRLMDYDNNVKRFIDEFAEEFYAALKPSCDWNSRYWEQLSLLKLDRFFSSPEDRILLDESIQHARSAIRAEVHPYSLTTLAKVLFRAMEHSKLQRDDFFREAWESIVEANARESRWDSRGATLFIVCFSGVLNFLKLGGQLTGDQYQALRDMVATTRALKIRERRLIALRDELSSILGRDYF